MRITWLGNATVLVEAGTSAVYIDPYLDPFAGLNLPKAALILVSHWHPGHCTRESVEMLSTDDTVVLGTADVAREFFGAVAMKPGERRTVAGISVTAMPARTIHHIGGHTEGFVLGFMLEISGKKVYYTSDTDLLPEMQGLAPDVLLVPVGGTTTMGPGEAAKAAVAIKAKLAIPIHWGGSTGTMDDAELFREFAERQGVRALVLQPGQMVEV